MSKGKIIITFVLLGFAVYFAIGMIDSFNDVNDALKEQAIAENELEDAKKEVAVAEKELEDALQE